MAHSKLYIQIMNSSRWRMVRGAQLQAQPFCEICEQRGVVTAAQVVHHIREIESAGNDAEAWELATSMGNLQSLCYKCHHELHTHKGYHSKDAHKQRNEERLKQWTARL